MKFIGLLILSLMMIGCGNRTARITHPYAPASEGDRNSLLAQRLTQQAATLLNSDPAEAERLLREALGADLYHGPAHNNLGAVYLNRGQLYEAAGEFEWARKLMPGHPDPRLNLAMTLERAGQIDEAMATYGAALEVYAGHIPTIQALCRCQIRHSRIDDRTPEFLRQIALSGETQQWRDWARMQMLKTAGRP